MAENENGLSLQTGMIQNARKRPRYWLHILLFILTIITTYLIGLGNGPVGALWYSGAIIFILLSHEMGHFITARKYNVPVTLPYFIPVPLPPFGTMGAVIKMGGYIPNRRALFDIGVAGPLSGLVLIIPALFFGLKMSSIVDAGPATEYTYILGDSLFFRLMAHVALGPLQAGKDISLHPLAYAGWVGLLVTSLNLVPIGQLDGGHIIYALFKKKSKYIYLFFYITLVFITLFFYAGWIVLLVILTLIRRHPPTLYDTVQLNVKRKIIGFSVIIFFLLAFTPVPFGFGEEFGEGLIPIIMEYVF